MSSDAAPRQLLIALDAFPPSLLEAWCDDGSLPNLKRLREDGQSGRVDSEADLFPGSVWPTFVTTTDVSFHANYHPAQWDPDSRKLRAPAADWCGVTPFWHRLAAQGIPAIALDVPFSHSARQPANTTEVLGWGMHDGLWSTSHPAGLLRELNKRHGSTSLVREGPGTRPEADLVVELDGLITDVARRTAIIEDLASRFDWRLMLAVFPETPRAGHWFWGETGTGVPQGGLKRVATAVDGVLPRLRSLLRPQDQLAFFSVHGVAATHDSDRVGEAALLYLDPSLAAGAVRRLDPVYLLRHVLPMSVVRYVTKKLPRPVYDWAFYHLQNAGRDWSQVRSIIFPIDQLIYATANLSPPEDGAEAKEAHIAWLRTQFEGMSTPDGQPVIERIVRPTELYGGPRLALLPDLVVRPADGPIGPIIVMADGRPRSVPRHSSRDGEHVREGFYVQVGPGISPGSEGPTVAGDRLAAFLCEPAGITLPAPD